LTRLAAHKIRLKPNKKQEEFLLKCCGTARFVYNWGLDNWEKSKEKPNWTKIDHELNVYRHSTGISSLWRCYEVSKKQKISKRS